MLLHVEHGMKGRVFDLDTSQEVLKVISLDLQSFAPTVVAGHAVMDGLGEVQAYKVGADGKEVGEDHPDGWRWLTYRAKGRFRFVPTRMVDPAVAKLVMGAPACTLCGSDQTLRGDDLCPSCRAKERGQRHTMTAERVDDPFALAKCERCSATATWTVSDEVETTPTVTGVSVLLVRGRKVLVADNAAKRKFAWDKAATVHRRHFCDKHYQPPRLLDARGEVVQDLDTRARPS